MKLEFILKQYLKDTPQARERRNKVRCISNLVRKNHPAIENVHTETMDNIVDDIVAYERLWRKILLENPDLRGIDYDTKKTVIQKKQIELGYESGYNRKI